MDVFARWGYRYLVKTTALALLAVAAFAAAASRTAASPTGTSFTYHHIFCKADTASGAIGCLPTAGVGYSVFVTPDAVGVIQIRTRKIVFFRRNRGRAATHLPTRTGLFTFNHLRCTSWPTATVFCARLDDTGLAVVISPAQAAVLRLADMTRIFVRNT